ncbi:MAG TPA: DUF4142 domain-containing protein [Chryseolinea sp.]|nr:DUF4142 domain-containing protein [Chryseolinea sp.]
MKNVIILINICIVVGVTMLLLDFEADPATPLSIASMQQANPGITASSEEASNATKGAALASLRRVRVTTPLSKNESLYVKDFISEMTQVRMMDREESKLAVQRGTSRPLKDYGAWMVLNQQQMLDDLNRLAAHHGIETTRTLNDALTADLSELHKLHGKKFDVRYIKSMIAEHKRDLKRLERASYSQDPDVQVFAARYISLAKDNLAKLQEIKRSY